MNLKDKVVLVTGACSGIGAAIAEKFAVIGAKVAMVGRNEKKLKDVSQNCEKSGNKHLMIVADLTKEDDAKRIVHETLERFGRLDVLVNNAGISGKGATILSQNIVQEFDDVMSVNFRSVVVLSNLAAPHLVESKGNIINISSVAATATFEIDGSACSAYCTSKAALDHFTRSLALELAPKGVRANTVNPGPVKIDIAKNSGVTKENEVAFWDAQSKATALGRFGDAEEIADVVVFLASDKARSITGASFVIGNGVIFKAKQ